ncbi:MAG: Mut7-C RNAse domain-containing protein [Caldilineaceae bacterium]
MSGETPRLKRPDELEQTPIKFILDVHLGKLARWLRLLGFDTLYRNDYDDPEIVEIAACEGRTILTRDGGIMKRRAVIRGYHIQSTNPEEQLRELFACYPLEQQIKPFRRCLACNGLLKSVDKATILHLLEPKTIHYYDEFFRCTDCQKIYWRGTHFTRMEAFVARVIAEMAE